MGQSIFRPSQCFPSRSDFTDVEPLYEFKFVSSARRARAKLQALEKRAHFRKKIGDLNERKKYQTPSLGCEPIRSQAILITNGLRFTFCMPKNIINNIRKQFGGVKALKLVTLSTFKKSKICLLLWYLRKKIGDLNERKKISNTIFGV